MARQHVVAGAAQQLQRPGVERGRPGEVAPEGRGQREAVEREGFALQVALAPSQRHGLLGKRLRPDEVALDRREDRR